MTTTQIILVALLLISAFLVSQLSMILVLYKHNEELRQELARSRPPF
jgi:hypothetical protein